MSTPTPVSLQPSKPTYWIIVSNEGPARVPYQHKTFQAAEEECFRLSTEHPGLTFTIFEAKLTLETPTAPTKRTAYENQISWSYWVPWSFAYQYRNAAGEDIPF